MDIFFCDVCCARVTNSHLNRGQGALNGDVVVCGSCLEKGHGSELLKQAQPQRVLVGAAPNLAGSGVLDGLRDRARTRHLTPMIPDIPDIAELSASPSQEEASIEDVIEENDLVEDAVFESESVHSDSVDEGPAEDELVESSLNLAADVEPDSVDVGSKLDAKSEQQQQQEKPDNFDSPDVAVADISDADDESGMNNIEEKPESSSISVDDIIDDLLDEADGEQAASNHLDDADDEAHTDSYSADELAAIKRLAEKEESQKTSTSSSQSKKSVRGKSSKSIGSRRSTASSARGTAISGRKKASGSSKRSSRRVSTKATKAQKLGPGGLPMPLFISLITIPLMLVLFLIFRPSGSGRTVDDGPRHGPTTTGMTSLIKDATKIAREGLNNDDLPKIKKALGMIGQIVGYMDEFERNMKAQEKPWTDNQIGTFLRKAKWNDLYGGISRSLRDKKLILEQ